MAPPAATDRSRRPILTSNHLRVQQNPPIATVVVAPERAPARERCDGRPVTGVWFAVYTAARRVPPTTSPPTGGTTALIVFSGVSSSPSRDPATGFIRCRQPLAGTVGRINPLSYFRKEPHVGRRTN